AARILHPDLRVATEVEQIVAGHGRAGDVRLLPLAKDAARLTRAPALQPDRDRGLALAQDARVGGRVDVGLAGRVRGPHRHQLVVASGGARPRPRPGGARGRPRRRRAGWSDPSPPRPRTCRRDGRARSPRASPPAAAACPPRTPGPTTPSPPRSRVASSGRGGGKSIV